jgi:hypothetical protein
MHWASLTLETLEPYILVDKDLEEQFWQKNTKKRQVTNVLAAVSNRLLKEVEDLYN